MFSLAVMFVEFWFRCPTIALAQPLEVSVNWAHAGHYEQVRVSVAGQDASVSSCVRSGLELYFRFELMLCRARSMWFDKCEHTQVYLRSMQFDPISETYRVSLDLIGDKKQAQELSYTSIERALDLIRTVTSISLDSFGGELAPGIALSDQKRKRAYVSTRVISACRGDYSETLERISYFVSLGLLRTSGSDSGWIDFRLDQ